MTGRVSQPMHWLIRVIWFCTVGWMLGLVMLVPTVLLAVSIIGLPFVPWWASWTWSVATLRNV